MVSGGKNDQTYGVNRTARILRLDYSGLKKRLESTVSDTASEAMPSPQFMEPLPSELTAAAECALECRRPDGTTIRIHLKGPQLPDLAALPDAAQTVNDDPVNSSHADSGGCRAGRLSQRD